MSKPMAASTKSAKEEEESQPTALPATTTVESKGEIEKIEKVDSRLSSRTEIKPSKRRKVSRHCRRFWCCYCIGLFVLLAAGLPILFLVIIPAIAQRMVNSSSLPVSSVSLLDPTPNSAVLSLQASIKIPKPFKVRLDPFDLQLYRPQTKPNIIPIVTLKLDEQWVEGNTTINVTNQTVQIEDKNQFIEFLRDAVFSENFVLAAKGSTTAHLGKLKTKIKFEKDIPMVGLNKLDGFSIKSASLLLAPEPDGSNLLANITIPNNSIVSFELGNQTLNIKANNIILGNVTIYNVAIVPGNNTFSARGYLDLKTILVNLQSIVAYTAPALAQGNLQLGAPGNKTIYHGQHIDYYEDIMNSLPLTGTIPLLSLLAESASQFLGGGVSGIRNLTDTLGLNLTQILQTLTGGGGSEMSALPALSQMGMADLSRFIHV